jgi:hypothetical protein
MPLKAGDETASDGLAKAIFDNLKAVLGPSLESSGADMDEVSAGWKKLSYAIAAGVVNHLVANMEIYGIQTTNGDTQNSTVTGHVR